MNVPDNLAEDEHCKTDDYEMWINDGIFFIVHISDHVSLKLAKEIVSERKRICKGTPFPMFSDSRMVVQFEKEARQYLAEATNTSQLIAGAILIENQLQKILGNFFLLINKPNIPAKLFTNEDEAVRWLQQFKSKTNF